MKNFLLVSLLFVLSINCYSQNLVSISDSNFRNVLKTKYPNCFSGDLLDTIKSKNITGSLTLSNNSVINSKIINSIQGIEYFKSLDTLSIYSIPHENIVLPSKINHLTIEIAFYSSQNLDSNFYPIALKSLILYGNGISFSNNFSGDTLNYFPNRLEYLTISRFLNVSNISNIPKNIKNLTIDNISNQFYSDSSINIPDLSKSLTKFNLNYGAYTISKLPESLRYFDCSNSSLNSFPKLPLSLSTLICSFCNLTEINDSATYNLGYFDFSNNQISHFPRIGKKLKTLYADKNNLGYIPLLPDNIESLSIDAPCIPNYPLNLKEVKLFSSLSPLCTPWYNPNNCDVNPTVVSKVFYDLNYNNVFDFGDSICTTYSYYYSHSKFFNRDDPTYINSDSTSFYVLTNPNDTLSIEVSTFSVDTNFDFEIKLNRPSTFAGLAMNTKTYFNYAIQRRIPDMAIIATPVVSCIRPGFPFQIDIKLQNQGNKNIVVCELFTTLPDSLKNLQFFIGSKDPMPGKDSISVTGQDIGGSIVTNLFGNLSENARLGDTLVFDFNLKLDNNEFEPNLSNNRSSFKMIVKGSFDPNEIVANPTLLDQNKISTGEEIEYTIHFQNTGTDTAFTVVVKDTLSQLLDASSFTLLANSHPMQVSKNNSLLNFTFANILLPDSGTNQKKSHGYVKYKIKSQPNISKTSTIENRAAIYFDFNKAVLTNYAISTFPQNRVITSVSSASTIHSFIYPNPLENNRIFYSGSTPTDASLYNSIGNLVKSGIMDEKGWEIGNLPTGIYLVQLGDKFEKMIIE